MGRIANAVIFLSAGVFFSPIAHASEFPSTEGIQFSEPVLNKAELASPFGVRNDRLRDQLQWHGGVDISAPWDAPVHAPASGEVVFADMRAGYGRMIDLKVSESWVIRFAHLSDIHVKNGDQVDAGDVLGKVGSTGPDTDPHLHLEARFDDKQYDPLMIGDLNLFAVELSGD